MPNEYSEKFVKIFLEASEWTNFECKRAATDPSKLLETVVSFANTNGGWLVIGLEDQKKAVGKKRLIGVSEKPDNVSEFLKLLEKDLEPPVIYLKKFELNITNTQGQPDKLLVVSVKKSDEVHSLKRGDTFSRKGSQNIKIGSSEITRLKYEKGAIKFEDEKSEVMDLADLDLFLFNLFKKDTSSQGDNDWQFLKDNGLAIKKGEEFFLTKAGVLLFGKNPSILLKCKCGIKVSHYYGTEPSYSGKPNFIIRPFSIEGPLLKQIEEMMDYFRKIVRNSPPKLNGASFNPSFLIPEWAFQEAITNAVVHRNYSIQDDIQVRFFDDRVEIESPGSYPGHVTVENIRSERFSRNPIIVRTLNRFQSAPNLDIGEGVDRMFKVMKDQNLYEPLFFSPSLRPNSVLLVLLNLQKIEYWDTVSKYLDENYKIANEDARRITRVNDTIKMSRMLKLWVSKGLLEKVDSKFRGDVFYKKAGVSISKEINQSFANGLENGK